MEDIDSTEVIDNEYWIVSLGNVAELMGRAQLSIGKSIASPNHVQGELALAFLKKAVRELEETLDKNSSEQSKE
jgi:hypothetical protein